MKKNGRVLILLLVLSFIVGLFMVVPVSATGEIKATFKGTVGGTVPAGCKFEITIDCFDLLESVDSEPIKPSVKKTFNTDDTDKFEYVFDSSEVNSGGYIYRFTMTGTGNNLIIADDRVILVYLRQGAYISYSDSAVEGEQEYDEEHPLDFEFKCSTLSSVKVDLTNAKPVTKVYDGTTAVVLDDTNYKLSGVKEGHDVKLAFSEGGFNDPNVRLANKVTLKGLSLTGADANKYSLTTKSVELKGKITPRPITVTADTVLMTKGTIEPTLTYQTSEPILEGNTVIGSLARTSGNDIGEYDVTRGTLDFGPNYEITFVDGKFIVSNYTLTEVADSVTGIRVSGYFDKKSILAVNTLGEDSAIYNVLKPSAAWGQILSCYDIKIDVAAHDGNFKIKIPVDAKFEGKEVAVYQQMSTGATMTYKSVVTAGEVTIESIECTQFMLATEKEEEKDGSVFLSILKVLGIIILVILGLAIVIVLFFFGMIFFNKTDELKKIIKVIKSLLKK